ncbi:hypothetical protein CRYUN_Cryun18bG0046600 [Craigia yunnanensis]
MEDFYDIKASKINGQTVCMLGIFDGRGGSLVVKHGFLDSERDTYRDDGSVALTAVLVGNISSSIQAALPPMPQVCTMSPTSRTWAHVCSNMVHAMQLLYVSAEALALQHSPSQLGMPYASKNTTYSYPHANFLAPTAVALMPCPSTKLPPSMRSKLNSYKLLQIGTRLLCRTCTAPKCA